MLKIASASTFLLGVPQPYYAGTTTEASFGGPLFCGDQKGFRSWSFFVSWTNRIEIAPISGKQACIKLQFPNFPQDSLRKVCQKSSLRFLWWLLQVIHIETELHCRTWRKCFRFFVDTLSSRSCYDKYPTIVINGFWWSLSDTGDTCSFFSLLPKRQSDRRLRCTTCRYWKSRIKPQWLSTFVNRNMWWNMSRDRSSWRTSFRTSSWSRFELATCCHASWRYTTERLENSIKNPLWFSTVDSWWFISFTIDSCIPHEPNQTQKIYITFGNFRLFQKILRTPTAWPARASWIRWRRITRFAADRLPGIGHRNVSGSHGGVFK